MTEELKDEKKEELKQEEKKEISQYTESENQALGNGWVPKDQWDGDPEEWVPAKQFIRNGELFGRINSYKNKILNLERTMGELVKHNERIYDVGYQDALGSLKKEKKAALLDGDTQKVLAIEEEVEKLQEDYNKKKQDLNLNVKPQATVTPNPVWEAWVGGNSWYETDVALRGYADGEAQSIVQTTQNAGKTVEFDKLLKEVSRKVKEKFPERFGNYRPPSSTTKGDNDVSVRRTSPGKQYQLSETEEEVFKTLAKSGMKREKYIDDLQKLKARKGG